MTEQNKNAPRLNPAKIEATIKSEQYHVFAGTTVTVCMLKLTNGAKVIGHNYGSIDPNQQDWLIGKIEARNMAVEKVWELEGYLLRERLTNNAFTYADSSKAFPFTCPDCNAVFPEGITSECPNNAVGCNDLLVQGK